MRGCSCRGRILLLRASCAVQYVGRLLLPADNKDTVVVHDYLDNNVPVLLAMFNRRRSGYRKLGLT